MKWQVFHHFCVCINTNLHLHWMVALLRQAWCTWYRYSRSIFVSFICPFLIACASTFFFVFENEFRLVFELELYLYLKMYQDLYLSWICICIWKCNYICIWTEVVFVFECSWMRADDMAGIAILKLAPGNISLHCTPAEQSLPEGDFLDFVPQRVPSKKESWYT